MVVKKCNFKRYVDTFNTNDEETVIQHVNNSLSWDWLDRNIPFFECPDKELEETYYFRWWVYRKHIRSTPDGFIITEFLPDVDWAGKHNSISCAVGHHLYEGRWLRDSKYLKDYICFWFCKGGNHHSYSNWIMDAVLKWCEVQGDFSIAKELLPGMVTSYNDWERSNLHNSGLFWSHDGNDGMELSISGSGLRPTLNSYMYGNAEAIRKIAQMAGDEEVSNEFSKKAASIKKLVQGRLWDYNEKFFKVQSLHSVDSSMSIWDFKSKNKADNVCELLGFTPWYFNLPDKGLEEAWKQVLDEEGFQAKYGLTTAEQRHPGFAVNYEGHECQWNGPVWPYATSIMLVAMANLLRNYDQEYINRSDYLNQLKLFASVQKRQLDNGKDVHWIDENMNPYTGDWIARTRLSTWQDGTWCRDKGGYERGKDYNHSTFCDLIISGLIGVIPSEFDQLEINPIIPEGKWDYFCLDHLQYHGKEITVVYDVTGEHYTYGKGFAVYVNGREVFRTDKLGKVKIRC